MSVRAVTVTAMAAAVAFTTFAGTTAAHADSGKNKGPLAVVGPTTSSPTVSNTPLGLTDTEQVIGADD